MKGGEPCLKLVKGSIIGYVPEQATKTYWDKASLIVLKRKTVDRLHVFFPGCALYFKSELETIERLSMELVEVVRPT